METRSGKVKKFETQEKQQGRVEASFIGGKIMEQNQIYPFFFFRMDSPDNFILYDITHQTRLF